MNEQIKEWYFKNYRKLIIIPIVILFIALVLIGIKVNQTGDFVNKDITLKGGISLSISKEANVNNDALKADLVPIFSPHELSVRGMRSAGKQVGILIESDIPELSEQQLKEVLAAVQKQTGTITRQDYSLEVMGSSLGESFFSQTIRAIFIAFIFMAIVVFFYFRKIIPCVAVVLCAFADIVVTIAVLNIMDFKIGTAGIAALIMLIGYSVDTDTMLTIKLLKRKEQSVKEAFFSAFKTGMTMTFTTLAAVTAGLFFTQSEVIRQIMTVIFVGLIIDFLYTWVQNAGMIFWYIERKEAKKQP